MSRIAFGSFSVVVPPGWADITDSVEAEEPPFTLAREEGVGALQFSVALHTSGPVPDPSPNDLSAMVGSFAAARGLGSPREVAVEFGPPRLAAGSFAWGGDFLRAWQVSDSHSFALVTYTCESGREDRELGDCEGIVRSLRFERASRRA